VRPKDDDDQMMGRENTTPSAAPPKKVVFRGSKPINASVDWNQYTNYFDKTQREKLVNSIAGILLQTKTGVDGSVITSYADQSNREEFIKTATIQIMSTPEYQLC